jgi:glycosyltransferase involved in cell wall biosynthesis
MIGRINSWKGQDLLVEATAALSPTLRGKIDIKFAGATFEAGQEAEELARLVDKAGIQGQVQFEGFVKDPFDFYQWADIVVVPSKKPEPFGLVAVEAMAHGRPVIAANHGGLMEIVVHERTGLLFEPGNAQALSAMLSHALANHAEMQVFGRQGQARYREEFTETKYKENFVYIVEGVLRKDRDRDVT